MCILFLIFCRSLRGVNPEPPPPLVCTPLLTFHCFNNGDLCKPSFNSTWVCFYFIQNMYMCVITQHKMWLTKYFYFESVCVWKVNFDQNWTRAYILFIKYIRDIIIGLLLLFCVNGKSIFRPTMMAVHIDTYIINRYRVPKSKQYIKHGLVHIFRKRKFYWVVYR